MKCVRTSPPGLVKVTLRPRPGYVPKVLSTSFRSQVVTLHSFHPPPFAPSEDERLHMLCSVRALKIYVDRSNVWRKSPQLLLFFLCWLPWACHIKANIFSLRWLTRCVAFLHLSAFGRILLGAWPPLKLFSEGFP